MSKFKVKIKHYKRLYYARKNRSRFELSPFNPDTEIHNGLVDGVTLPDVDVTIDDDIINKRQKRWWQR